MIGTRVAFNSSVVHCYFCDRSNFMSCVIYDRLVSFVVVVAKAFKGIGSILCGQLETNEV